MSKPLYRLFNEHREEMLERLSKGVSRKEIFNRIEKKHTVSRLTKFLISGLGKTPQEQTVTEWLADYVNGNDETRRAENFNKLLDKNNV